MKSQYPHLWNYLTYGKEEDINPYAQEWQIPLGTSEHPSYYSGEIPENDIIVHQLKDLDKDFNQREACNILILGASGDGKTLIEKNIWCNILDLGFNCVFIDPKSYTSGRAKLKWGENTKRIAPHLKPKGIKLKHYIPAFRHGENLLEHNFKIYSLRPSDLKEMVMWESLRLSPIATDFILEIINRNPKSNVDYIIRQLEGKMKEKTLNSQAFHSSIGKLIIAKRKGIFDEQYQQINLLEDFKEGYSVCISYNSGNDKLTCLDIGLKIHQCNDYYLKRLSKNPVMFFLDDASFFTDPLNVPPSENYAVEQIKNIIFNYRANGIYCTLAVQSLSIINASIVEEFPIILISPLFKRYDELIRIGIPMDIIYLFKTNQLIIDSDNHALQWIKYYKGKWELFFPFTPQCEHFREIYFQRKLEKEIEA